MPTISGVHHIALTVRNLAVSEPFYARLFGVEAIATMPGEGWTRRIFRPIPGLTIGLTQHDAGEDVLFTPVQPGLDHIGFACADSSAIEEWRSHLDAVGIEHSAIMEESFGTALVVKDPDDIPLEFYLAAQPDGI